MPQGQYNTNAAGIGEQSVNTGSPRAAAWASPLRRRSPGGFLGGFSGQVQRVYPARLWRGHLSPFGFGSGFGLALFVQLCNGGQDFANSVKFFVGAIANDLQKRGSVFGIGHGLASPFVCVRVCACVWVERIEMYFCRRRLKFALYGVLIGCLYRCMSL